jgi:hypothetical protein
MTVLPVIGGGKLWGVWPASDMKGAQAFVDRKIAEGAFESGELLIVPEQWNSPKPIGEFPHPMRWGTLCVSIDGRGYEVPRLKRCHLSYDADGDDHFDESVRFDYEAKFYLADDVDELVSILEMILRRALEAPDSDEWRRAAKDLLE